MNITTKQRNAQERSSLAKLKRLGLYSGSARKNATKYGKTLIKKYADVLAGQAQVVIVKSHTVAKTFVKAPHVPNELEKARGWSKLGVRVKGRKVIIPKSPSQKYIYKPKLGKIISTSEQYGVKITTELRPAGQPLPKFHTPGNKIYAINLREGANIVRKRFTTYQDLEDYMIQGTFRPWDNWQDWVEIEEIDAGDDMTELDEAA